MTVLQANTMKGRCVTPVFVLAIGLFKHVTLTESLYRNVFMGTQSTAKTIFLLISMAGWLIVGASLMYLFPAVADQLLGSQQTHLWIDNLTRGGYNPSLGIIAGGVAFIITLVLNLVWYQRFEGRV